MAKTCVTTVFLLAMVSGMAMGAPGEELSELIPSAGAELFGKSVAIDGDSILVGSPGSDTVYLFDASNPVAAGVLLVYSNSNNESADFGESVGIDGVNVVIGELGAGEANGEGGVSYFTTASSGLVHIDRDNNPSSDMGSSIAISGTNVLVGAPFGHIDNISIPGFVWFTDTINYAIDIVTQQPTGDTSDRFGESVDLTSSRAVVGMPERYENDIWAGVVHVYSNSGSWQREIIVSDSTDRNQGDQFGFSVSISESNDLVLIGAPGDDEAGANAGAAYLYNASTGAELYKLVSPELNFDDRFGYSVELTEEYAIVGATGVRHGARTDGGAVYIFDLDTGTQIAKLQPNAANQSFFGAAIASSGSTLVVGASHPFFGDGNAYLFSLRCNEADFSEPFGKINPFDLSGFTMALNNEEPEADINGDGVWNFFDVSAFLAAYSAGC